MNENELLNLIEQRTVRANKDVHQLLIECVVENKPIVGIIRHRNGSMTFIRVKETQPPAIVEEIVRRMRPIQS